LAVSNEIKGLSPAPGDFPFLSPPVRIPLELRARAANAERSAAAEAQASPKFPFYHDFRFSGRNCRAAPAARVRNARRGARCPRQGGRIAELTPNGSNRVRWFGADFRHRPGG
jgi:hypothetical protein